MWNFSSSMLVVHFIIKLIKVKRVAELARVFDSVNPDANTAVGRDARNVLTATKWLTVASIFVSMIGIYYKREVIKGVFTKRPPQNSPPSLGRCSLSLVKEKASDQWIVLSPQSI